MMKGYQKFQGWVSERVEDFCSRLSSGTQRIVVFLLFFFFAVSSLYITCDAFYRIGKNEGKKEILKIEHIDSVPLMKNDSINKKINNSWKQRAMKG